MNYTSRRDLTKVLEERFGNRCKPHGIHAGPLATVIPADAEEVGFLAESVRRYSGRLSPAGAGTDPDLPEPTGDTVLVRTEMMRKIRFPDGGRVEVEPGVLWVDLEDELRFSHQALTVYPTSAPRATVGGWVARDGMGVGSFEFGWLRENVISVEVVLPDGRLRTLEGDDLGLAVGAMGRTGVIVRATLKLRETEIDRPFAISFARQETLQRAVDSLLERRPPLWHLGIVNPTMARAMRSREGYMIFGAYPASGAAAAEGELARVSGENRGAALDAAEAYRMWGGRFFPVAPARPTPAPGRVLVPASRVGAVLDHLMSGPAELAVLGSVARDGSALLLAFANYGEEDRPRSLSAGDESALVGIARSVGGDLYHAVLMRRAELAR
ncbi:MAG TPA: FAD-binding oxidoreductase [Rubrobacter sp.]|nr:FAD-binding oxidoreductase [Rubrobacter sp.]